MARCSQYQSQRRLLCLPVFLPTFLAKRFGRFVMISSLGAGGASGQANYAASKAGLAGPLGDACQGVWQEGYHQQRDLPRLHRDRHDPRPACRRRIANSGCNSVRRGGWANWRRWRNWRLISLRRAPPSSMVRIAHRRRIGMGALTRGGPPEVSRPCCRYAVLGTVSRLPDTAFSAITGRAGGAGFTSRRAADKVPVGRKVAIASTSSMWDSHRAWAHGPFPACAFAGFHPRTDSLPGTPG